ncbi:hypothetical protein P8605_00070 [Streptomyces sp. T-3]|nr:hypothetical protein [Streptomyces sp. T-3]
MTSEDGICARSDLAADRNSPPAGSDLSAPDVLAVRPPGRRDREIALRLVAAHARDADDCRNAWLAVFRGGFDPAVAEEVCADSELDAQTIVDHLIGLVDKSAVLRLEGEQSWVRRLDPQAVPQLGGRGRRVAGTGVSSIERRVCGMARTASRSPSPRLPGSERAFMAWRERGQAGVCSGRQLGHRR